MGTLPFIAQADYPLIEPQPMRPAKLLPCPEDFCLIVSSIQFLSTPPIAARYEKLQQTRFEYFQWMLE